jgi:uncharacterized protein (DUF433 family)
MTRTGLTDTGSGVDRFRYGKAYTVGQAARLADVSPVTVRRWIAGYERSGHQRAPLSGSDRAEHDAPVVSFLQLIETVVVAQFCGGNRSVQLDRLRRAHVFAQERFQLPCPFASLKLREVGGAVLHDFDVAHPDGPTLAVDIGGTWAIPGAVTQVLDRVDFSKLDHLAERWHLAGRSVSLVLDPRIGGGRLTVLGTGVTVDTIHQRFLAGESIEYLASDYELDSETIQEAIRFADRGSLAVA